MQGGRLTVGKQLGTIVRDEITWYLIWRWRLLEEEKSSQKAKKSDRLLVALLALAVLLIAIGLNHIARQNGPSQTDKVQLIRMLDSLN